MIKKRKSVKSKTGLRHHLRATLTYTAEHKHTGKRLPHRHTSHGLLLLILIAAGIILFLNFAVMKAAGITISNGVTVSLTVPGAPPTEGAVITSPQHQSRVTQALLRIEGTCPVDTYVSIFRNGEHAGSVACASPGTFRLTVQLAEGNNTLQAQNYDNLDQPGPTTPQITIEYVPDEPDEQPALNASEDIVVVPTIPVAEMPQPTESSCEASSTPTTTDELIVSVPCITRNIFVGEKLQLPVFISGGIPPYALSVDWGDESGIELHSLNTAGRHVLSHTYLSPISRALSLKAADAKGKSYQIQSVIVVNGDAGAAALVDGDDNPVTSFFNSVARNWIEASVPVYWAIVAIFLGFWVGDLFQRFFGTNKLRRRAH